MCRTGEQRRRYKCLKRDNRSKEVMKFSTEEEGK